MPYVHLKNIVGTFKYLFWKITIFLKLIGYILENTFAFKKNSQVRYRLVKHFAFFDNMIGFVSSKKEHVQFILILGKWCLLFKMKHFFLLLTALNMF